MGHDPETQEILRGIPGFEKLDGQSLDTLAACTTFRSIAENTAIYKEDENSYDVFLIMSGIISIRSRLPSEEERYSELLVLRSGSFFGVLAFLDGSRRNLSAFTRERSLLMRFDGPRLKADCKANADLGRAVYMSFGGTAARLARDVSMELRNLMIERG
jgi:CRP-like cAMP-binding protein